MTHTYRPAALVALVASLCAAGCGGKPTGDLSGKVTYKGKSVVLGTVTVYDADKKAYQGGIDQGSYVVKNVPEGAVQIIVVSPNPGGGGDSVAEDPRRPKRDARPGEEKGPPVVGWVALPKKYEEVSSSPLKTTVKAGPNPFDLELKD